MTMSWRLTDTHGLLCNSQAEFLHLYSQLATDQHLLKRISSATRTDIVKAKTALKDALVDLFMQLRLFNVKLPKKLSDYLVTVACPYAADRENKKVFHIDPQEMEAVRARYEPDTEFGPDKNEVYRITFRAFVILFPKEARILEKYAKEKHGARRQMAHRMGLSKSNLRQMVCRARKLLHAFTKENTRTMLRIILQCQDHILRKAISRVYLNDGTVTEMRGVCVRRRGSQFIFDGEQRSDRKTLTLKVKCSMIVRIDEIDERGEILN